MTCSAHQALRQLDSRCTRAFLSEERWSVLLDLASQLPELGGSQYLECRLGPRSSGTVDFLVAITKLERRILSRQPFLSRHEMLPAKRLLQRWTNTSSALHEVVPVAWLEFDDVMGKQSRPRANVCPGIVPSYVDPFAPLTNLPPAEQVSVLEELVEVIRGRACTHSEQGLLARAVHALPPGASWIHLSVMTEREPVELKLYGVFPQHSLLGYLERVGWPGARAELEELIDRYCPTSRTGSAMYIDLPLTRALELGEAALGICFSRRQLRSSLETDPRRLDLLRALHEDELCTEEEMVALAAWPRSASPETAVPGTGTQLERWLDVKVVHRGAERPSAKAYLGFSAMPSASPHPWSRLRQACTRSVSSASPLASNHDSASSTSQRPAWAGACSANEWAARS